MWPPFIVSVPWVISILLELWLLQILYRRGLYREVPVFAAMVTIYAVLDILVFGARLSSTYPYPMFTIREIASAVLRTWMLVELCRQMLRDHRWTKRLLVFVLLGSAAFLVGVGYPIFLDEHTLGLSNTYMHLGVWLRTAYFTQVGVIAVLLLINFNSMISGFSRETGMAIGIATASGAELVSMTLRGRPGGQADFASIGLNYVGMATAVLIWIMFLEAKFKAPNVEEGPDERDSARQAAS